MMAEPYGKLRDKMSPEAKARAEAKARTLMEGVLAVETGRARKPSQEQTEASPFIEQEKKPDA